ncbi:MAG: hypothetical protein O2960_12115 [Verrucomicrobia bacterium]|nr:hypothetical protein [Verrucomicrobiota bacterium]
MQSDRGLSQAAAIPIESVLRLDSAAKHIFRVLRAETSHGRTDVPTKSEMHGFAEALDIRSRRAPTVWLTHFVLGEANSAEEITINGEAPTRALFSVFTYGNDVSIG